NVQGTTINNAAGINSFAGPDNADRATALAGLNANERYVQALYLDALGRPGSKAELDAWAAFITGTDASLAVVASGIERSPEARTHLVRSWYQTFLGRPAQGNEEQGWVNLLLAGLTEERVLSIILGSPGLGGDPHGEFYQHAQTLIPSGTP